MKYYIGLKNRFTLNKKKKKPKSGIRGATAEKIKTTVKTVIEKAKW